VAYLNENYLKLRAGYLFPEIARRVRRFSEENPDAARRLIRCGIGDVTEPLPRAAIEAMKAAAEELGNHESFRGYVPEQVYEFLRTKITQFDYRDRGTDIADDEIFLSDGSKCDCGHILDILGEQNRIAIPDPVYPVYVDTNVMAGHTGAVDEAGRYAGLIYLACRESNAFVPEPPNEHADIVYRRFPNHPTGPAASRAQLGRPVSYPVQRGAEALYSAEGRDQVRALIDHYMGNARILGDAAKRAGMQVFGGKNAPYLWVKTPAGLTSWQMFDRMLHELNVVITPG